ncbi:MAG: HAD-IC family P-type ATPase [Thioalkalispiraceae bacterium]|jgi:magnesium-transporting ATPase (P-type)
MEEIAIPDNVHCLAVEQVLEQLETDQQGLPLEQVQQRQQQFGANRLPPPSPVRLIVIFLRQFLSPLIYILLAAAVVSIVIGEYSDAGFISIVLLFNAIIGTAQEYSAQQSATALQQLVTHVAHVIRNGENFEINAAELVPGDVVYLESGDKIPADLRLVKTQNLELDVSLLTGESLPVEHHSDPINIPDVAIADRNNMAYSGTLVTRGRGTGVVVATGIHTQLGKIAEDVLERKRVKPPLLLRMEKFSMRISILMSVMVIILGTVAMSRGMPFTDMLLMAAALAVAAIPEGLPVAMTVALSISMRRMAKRNVIVRKLVTVEALGSCTYIATDKTGTLTINEITASKLVTPDGLQFDVLQASEDNQGSIRPHDQALTSAHQHWLQRIGQAAVLANEGYIGKRNGNWSQHGDAVDVALLLMAHKIDITRPRLLGEYPEIASIPYESANQCSASLNHHQQHFIAHAKGALEKLLPTCKYMASIDGDMPLDASLVEHHAMQLASQGYRVLALVSGEIAYRSDKTFTLDDLNQLTLLGLVGMKDPLRRETARAIEACRQAGIEVGMVTGDHPVTARAVGNELGLASGSQQVITGHQIRHATTQQDMDQLTRQGRIYARVEPHQKLRIVESLQRNGHFVAVTGDGANDAPALRAAHVGVAMGKAGTDIAREASDMIITDDNFSSIVAGIEEGRIAYANVRKVILLLITTGVGELILFTLSLLAGLPLPLTAVQLLWLNLVTNGIQDVALAFEPGEGDELQRPPRSPREPIFNRLMVERVATVSVVIGLVAFLAFDWLLQQGYSLDEARNSVLLLMVFFENVHVFNSRSETRSIFSLNPLRNIFLLLGTIAAQLIHIGAMYTPGLSEVLAIQPISLANWLHLLQLALIAILASELHKFIWYQRTHRTTAH